MSYPHSEIKQLIFSFDKHDAIYFRVPKVASTSLLMTWRKVDQVEMVDEYDPSIFKFAFVRNPFDRLASCYRHVIKKGAMKNIQDDPRLYQGMSFKEFVNVIGEIEISNMDIHFRPQYTFIPEDPDFVGKFENIQEDYKTICEKIGIRNSPSLLWENKTDRTKYKDYYTPDIIEKVVKIYEKDFDLFGYNKTIVL